MSQGAPENIVGLQAQVNHDKNHDILECKGDNKDFDSNKVEKGMNTEVISNISGSVGSISSVVATNKALRITKDKEGQKGHQRHLSPKLKISRYPRLPGKQPRKKEDDIPVKTVKERIKDLEPSAVESVKRVKRNKICVSPNKLYKNSDKKYENVSKDKKSDKKKSKNVKDLIDEDDVKKQCSRSSIHKVKSLIDAFNSQNVKMDKVRKRSVDDNKMIKLDDKKEVKIKNAFCQLLESAQGGETKTHSPSRRYRKRIGSLKTPSHDKKQSLIDDWIGRRKVEKCNGGTI